MLMKSYTQFIKEVNYSAYGQATLGSTPGRATDQQIKSGVDRAIKNIGTGKGSGQIGQKGGFGLSGGVNVSMAGGSSGSPTKTKVRPAKTTDPGRSPINNTPKPNRPSLVSSSSSSTQSSPSRITNPKTQRISDMRMGRM